MLTAVNDDKILQIKAKLGKYLIEKCYSDIKNNSPSNIL